MKKNAKETFNDTIDDMLSRSEIGSKIFWQITGRILGKQTSTATIPPLCITDNTYAFDVNEKATTLNEYFCKISTIDDADVELPRSENRTETFLSDITVEQSEVIDMLSILKVYKATGPDGISHRMLRQTSKTISLPLCKLFNLSLKTNTYPALWKIAHVMPVFKKGDKFQPCNYRPISLISCIGKSFERILFKNVYNHLIENSLVYKYQSGFLPGHSTVHHLIESMFSFGKS